MRTTLALEDDATEVIQTYSRDHKLPLGKAASELIRRGARYQLTTRRLNGLPVYEAGDNFPVISTEQVLELQDD